MRNYLLPLAALLMAACSSPKYAYHFDKYDYNTGRGEKPGEVTERVPKGLPDDKVNTDSPLKVDSEMLYASVDDKSPVVTPPAYVHEAAVAGEAPAKSYKDMSRAERKEFRKEAKALIKAYIQAKKSGDEVKATEAVMAMDQDLKMAAIFGAVGIVALIIGGDVFWIIGGIALIIGVVFFVLWLSRQ